jgi:hypothetical protein
VSALALTRGGVSGNGEVSRYAVPGTRGDLRAAWAGANPDEEAGARGKHGFPRGSEPKASDA